MVDVSRASDASARGISVPLAATLAFGASAATLIVELIAARVLAPYIGSSLYTWTSIIGVVLAGISLGNWAGGRWASRSASGARVAGLFFLGAALSIVPMLVVPWLAGLSPVRGLDLLGRIFVLTTTGFLPPSFALAAITPLVITRAVTDRARAGRVIGVVYASGTAGSLIGNFATGFVLTAYLSVTTILLGVATILVVLALVSLRFGGTGESETDDSVTADDWAGTVARLGTLDLVGNVPLACVIVAFSSFATMGVELAASRILAPSLGLSLYSWTGIIGVVLFAITLGNYFGGWIADRSSDQRTLAYSLLAGAIATLAVLLLVELLDAHDMWGQLGLIERIVAETFVVFFVPVFFLGTISPQVVKLAITDPRLAGRVSGEIYAWSTAGAIAGTFATGWWLISALGVHALVFGLGLTLLLLALLVGRYWRAPVTGAAVVVLAVAMVGALLWRDAARSRCTVETNYFCIKVGTEERPGVGTLRTLVLDHLVHSFVKVGDPGFLGYVHEEVQSEIATMYAERLGPLRMLVIGGGGYTYPRWVDARLPGATVEVVEIDAGVTEVAHQYFAMPRDTRIQSFNLDGRQYVQEIAPPGAYALVVQDAVNDLSVPYHIMTREYNDRVRALLKPDGAYLLTVIDLYRDGQLLRSAARTMKQTFPVVQLLAASPAWESGGANVWVIAGSAAGIDVEALRASYNARGVQSRTVAMPGPLLDQYIADGPPIILSDEYAPVDNLIAILFRARG
ncbi:MAG: spermidine synthase [Chloroflexota bacterium]|nr:MAG: spermidine synthase [Chloroflexota bacterium]